MKIQITSKNYTVSEKLKEILTKKVSKLDRYFGDSATTKIVCRKDNKDAYTLELTISDKGMLFRSEVTSDNMYQNIDIALPKVERQVVKYSGKLKDKLHFDAFKDNDWLFFEDEDENEALPSVKANIGKRKAFEISPLTEEDAQMQLDNSGHDFFVFLSKETGKVTIIYKRKSGNYGIIEPLYEIE